MATPGGTGKRIWLRDLQPIAWNPREELTAQERDLLSQSILSHTQALADWDPEDGLRLASSITVNRQGNRIVGGHKRVEALDRLGQDWIHPDDVSWVDLVPDGEEEKALNLALNAEDVRGVFDLDAVRLAMERMKAAGADLRTTAFSPESIELFLTANYQPPPPPGDGSSGSDGGHSSPESVSALILTASQHKVLLEALDRLRSEQEDEFGNGEGVKRLCQAFLAAHPAA